ncbi:putative polyadenylation protein ASCRUDRAFT_81737 [Ascoidea rubescens DSM 1968]|uniref:Ubiquitin-conjugating enzyme E2C-binding protein n=1 Tax=Ascoidea rubescens DSM 1968 TaxID=1344418 RepID=A0A1D2VDS7_9ASCO|nr:hypothetical protein ASCRUDRAFT_81737 [Ascoidea rubescens DSM 1968]ODV59844.1 hypothetical protein ASCRUDRAFT_81737 [Ascoidea rubescens DSM 1968]
MVSGNGLKFLYYAEYFQFIQFVTISFQIDLDPKVFITELYLATKTTLEIHLSSSKVYKIPLPHQVDYVAPDKVPLDLLIYDTKNDCFTVKLRSNKNFQKKSMGNPLLELSKIQVQNAKNFKKFKIFCLNCDSIIIDSEDIDKVLDKPKELWYELLDFWYCHRPDISSNLNPKLNQSVLKPPKDSLLIGSYYFQLNKSDFGKSILSDSNIGKIDNGSNNSVLCSNCKTKIGFQNPKEDLDMVSLYKWSLKVTHINTIPNADGTLNNTLNKIKIDLFYPYSHAFNILLDSTVNQSTRCFCLSSNNKQILLFVSAIGSEITLTNYSKECISNTIKVFFTEDNNNIERILLNKDNKFNQNIDTIDLPQTVFADLVKVIKTTNSIIPTSCKYFNGSLLGCNGWSFGLIPCNQKLF